MLTRHVALVAEISAITSSELSRVSAAIQKQVTRDFGAIWEVQATVDSFPKLEDVPLGYWPVLIETDIGQAGALGVHLDKDNQPYALVTFDDNWSLTASHETLEMLADPFGNRLIASDSPKPDQGRVEFLVEVCDPSEASQFGYTVNGVTVSDFYTPSYFDPVVGDGVRYSFTGAITEPRQVLTGGYLSWHDPVSDHWWQEIFFEAQPEFRDLGAATALRKPGESLRSMIDRLTPAGRKSLTSSKSNLLAARAVRDRSAESSQAKARSLRSQIQQLKDDQESAGPKASPSSLQVRRAPRRGRSAQND